MGAASVRTMVVAWSRVHPDLAQFAIGAGVGVALLLVSVWQWGFTDDGVARGASIGLLLGGAVAFSWRRRRRADERRERALLDRRLQLARELHDAVAGQVAAIGIQAAAAQRVLATDPAQANVALQRIEIASRAAVADLRRMLFALRSSDGGAEPDPNTEPGLADIERLVGDLGQAGVTVRVAVAGRRPADMPSVVDQAGYRIAQEALTNVLKHAGTTSADVAIRYDADAVRVTITNAAGPTGRDRSATAEATASGGLGIVGMRERARLLGGSLTAGPTPDDGWAVSATLPLR